MRLRNLLAAGLGLFGVAYLANPVQAAPLPVHSAQSARALPITPVGDTEKAIIGGAIGGVIGGVIGSTIGQSVAPPPAAYPPPPAYYTPPPAYAAPPPPVAVQRPPARIVEDYDEEAAPEVVQERECITRETKVYDPNTDRSFVRKERHCH